MNLFKIAVGIKAVWILAAAFFLVPDKRFWIRENRFELSVIAGSILMIIVAGFNGERSLWAANLFAIVLLVRMWTLNAWLSVVVSVAMLMTFPILGQKASEIRNEFDVFLSTYLRSSDAVTRHKRVFVGPLARYFYQEPYTWCSGVHGNNIANFYGRKDQPIALPGDLYETLYERDEFCSDASHKMGIDGNFYTADDIPAIVHPLSSEEAKIRQWRVSVNYEYPTGFISRIRRSANISYYPHPVETDSGFVLNTKHGAYLLISKEYQSDAFVKSVELIPCDE